MIDVVYFWQKTNLLKHDVFQNSPLLCMILAWYKFYLLQMKFVAEIIPLPSIAEPVLELKLNLKPNMEP